MAEKRKGLWKLLGIRITDSIWYYISLYSFYKRVNKTDLIRPIIKRWYLEEIKTKPEEFLLSEITKTLQIDWDRCKIKSEDEEVEVSTLFKKWKREITVRCDISQMKKEHKEKILEKIEI